MKTAIQMYTLRDNCQTAEELLATLGKVKELGYDGVEFAGYAGIDAEKLKSRLKELNLAVVASHEGLDGLEQRADEIIEFNRRLGNPVIVCPWSKAADREDMERLRRVLPAVAQKAEKYGMKVMYHNHSQEFIPLADMENRLPIDVIKDICPLELDTYWVFNRHVDVCTFMRANADKIQLVHLKDGDLNGHPCAVGEGKNDVQAILDVTKEIGREWVIVENDNPEPDGLSDAARSIHNLKTKYRL